MRALICNQTGSIENLAVGELPDPEPGRGEVVVDVAAAALNFPDTLIVEGKYQFRPDPPFSPGSEVAGRVDAVGEGVDDFSVGDRVIATAIWGGIAEKFKAPATSVMPLPDALDDVTAAAISTTFGTSYHALKDCARILPGEWLLVLGAAGGVGVAAVMLGKAMGARVIAAASSDEKLKIARDAGADEAINYRNEDLKTRMKQISGGGVDVVYDPVGGALSEAALRGVRPGGRHLVVGFASGEIPKISLNLPLLKQAHIVGVFWGAWALANRERQARNFEELCAMIAEGKVKPLISEVLPLERAIDGLRALAERRAVGKIVIDMR